MAFVTDSNRPQPLWQPPPTASLTSSNRLRGPFLFNASLGAGVRVPRRGWLALAAVDAAVRPQALRVLLAVAIRQARAMQCAIWHPVTPPPHPLKTPPFNPDKSTNFLQYFATTNKSPLPLAREQSLPCRKVSTFSLAPFWAPISMVYCPTHTLLTQPRPHWSPPLTPLLRAEAAHWSAGRGYGCVHVSCCWVKLPCLVVC